MLLYFMINNNAAIFDIEKNKILFVAWFSDFYQKAGILTTHNMNALTINPEKMIQMDRMSQNTA